MAIKKFTLILAYLLTLNFLSCNKVTPAGFWENYNSRFLIKNISDQGPYGGHRALYWKSNEDNTFSSVDVIKFATENGWKLIDSSEYQAHQTTKWTYLGKSIFPLDHSG